MLKKAAVLIMCLALTLSILGFSACASSRSIEGIIPLVDDGSGEILPLQGKGPNGESPMGVEAILNLITPEKKEEIKKANYTAAICLHTTSSDWAILQIEGIKAALAEFNIRLLTITDAEMRVEKQIADYESVMEMAPDLMVVFILDKDASAPILRRAIEKGIKLAFIDAVPTGFVHPKDYAGMGTADNYANGRASAETLVNYLGGKGEIAVIKYISSLFHTDQRKDAALDVFAAHPDIKIVAEQGVSGPEEAATVTENILIANPDLKGIWAVWDAPGMAAVAMVENLGKDVKVVTVDLSEDTAYSIASGGAMLATGAQHPFDQGVAEAMIGIGALAGVETPAYVLVPGEKVTKESMERSWLRVFKTPLPDKIKEVLSK